MSDKNKSILDDIIYTARDLEMYRFLMDIELAKLENEPWIEADDGVTKTFWRNLDAYNEFKDVAVKVLKPVEDFLMWGRSPEDRTLNEKLENDKSGETTQTD